VFDGAGIAGSALQVAAGERIVDVSVESCTFANFNCSALAVQANDSAAAYIHLANSMWATNMADSVCPLSQGVQRQACCATSGPGMEAAARSDPGSALACTLSFQMCLVQGACGSSRNHDGGSAVQFRANGNDPASSFAAESCTFQDNRSASRAHMHNSMLALNFCLPLSCTASSGSWCEGGALAVTAANIALSGCRFLRNKAAGGSGGAVFANAIEQLDIVGCLFEGRSSSARARPTVCRCKAPVQLVDGPSSNVPLP